jgi:S1-C subfamily serine protease
MSKNIPSHDRASLLTRRDIFGRVKQSVVAIAVAHHSLPPSLDFTAAEELTPYEDYPFSIIGSGVVVDEVGVILTARHVVEDHLLALRHAMAIGQPIPAPPLVLFNERYSAENGIIYNDMFLAPVRVAQSSDLLDMAALGITQPKNRSQVPFIPLPIADQQCEESDEIAICGFPLGDLLIRTHPGPYFSPTFSAGIVSASLSFPEAPSEYRTHFRMDMMVNPGNSGGPVFNERTGEIVGIVVNRMDDFEIVKKGEPQALDIEGKEINPPDYVYIPTGLAHGIHARPWAETLIEGVKESLSKRAGSDETKK